jgi:AcrR family transcriptional regulator
MPAAPADVLERTYPGARSQLKRRILLGALACFNEHGLELTTIEMIKLRCETSVGNIYHHFGNKEGLVAALFFSAMDDQGSLLDQYLAQATTAREGVAAVVTSYVDWVARQPELARFVFQARSAVAKSEHGDALAQQNRQKHRQIVAWLSDPAHRAGLRDWPRELFASLVIGPAENYCRAWLSGRVRTSPAVYREQLADAAWSTLAKHDQPGREH